jgi:hypothetical protein
VLPHSCDTACGNRQYQRRARQSGYKTLLEQSFMPVLHAAEPTLPHGRLAVLYDKNKMVRGHRAPHKVHAARPRKLHDLAWAQTVTHALPCTAVGSA